MDRVPLSSESILGKGIRGTTRLVERIGTDETSDLDPLTEARSRLEYGQVDEARRVLEEAVLQYPMRGDLHRELLEIYVHSRDYTHFSAMLEALRSAGSPVPSAWRRLASALELVDTGDESPSMEHQGK
ncbi:MAG: hypothetical protein LJE70_19960 [Chromatiaceae bacterium]|nr:hypothetical protein [Chromatiaceae bacterium]